MNPENPEGSKTCKSKARDEAKKIAGKKSTPPRTPAVSRTSKPPPVALDTRLKHPYGPQQNIHEDLRIEWSSGLVLLSICSEAFT